MEYMKEVIEQVAGAVPEQTKANVDSKHNFDNDSRALIAALAKIGIAFRDENGGYRNVYDILKDISEKYEQLYDGQVIE